MVVRLMEAGTFTLCPTLLQIHHRRQGSRHPGRGGVIVGEREPLAISWRP